MKLIEGIKRPEALGDDMKTSTLLKRAEKYLWDGRGEYPHPSVKTEYICHALDRVARDDSLICHAARLSELIVYRLGRTTSYTGWAVERGLLPERYDAGFYPLIQANRLRWLRELQREFKAKGD